MFFTPSGWSASITAFTNAAGEPTVAGLADALRADRVVRRRRHGLVELERGVSHAVGSR